jgi:hypothetical protein
MNTTETHEMVTAQPHHHEQAWYAIHDKNGKSLGEPVVLAIIAQLLAERDHYKNTAR